MNSQRPASEPQLPSDLIDAAQRLLDKGGRRLLGIAGPPGAGKSTLAALLTKALGNQAVVVPMDGFHLANRELARLGRADRKGAADTFDARGYLSLLERLKHPIPGETVYAPAFDRSLEEPIAGSIPVPSTTPLVISEGNYLLLNQAPWPDVAAVFDERWYMQSDAAQRHARLIARHQHFGRSQEQAQAWVRDTDEPNAQLIERSRERADRIVPWP